jgi:arylsulfatase A-like enzyme
MNGKAEDAVDLAIKYLENNKKHKLFVFFHTYEIHSPYKHDYFVAQLPLSERTYRNNTIARYDSGIRYTDIQIGRLISWLKTNNLFEKTLIIITSDHGENFNHIRTKEGMGSHGNTLYDSEIHVPLILGGAVPFNQKLAIADQVSSVDILPTIMDFLNIPINEKARGISLMPLIDGKKMTQRMAYSEAIRVMEEKKSVRTLEYKLIANLNGKNKNNSDKIDYELYDLVHDERETENIFALKSTVAKTFIQYLKQIMKSVDVNRGQLAKTKQQSPQLDKELLNDLKGLGYIGN